MSGRSAEACREFNSRVLQLVRENKYDVVVLSSPFGGVLGGEVKIGTGEVKSSLQIAEVSEALRETVRLIRESGSRVVIVSPTPSSGWDIGQCLTRATYLDADEASCDFALDLEEDRFELLRSLESYVAVYWLHEDICADGACDVMQDGVFIYRDTGHLSKEGSAYLGRRNGWMDEFLRIAN